MLKNLLILISLGLIAASAYLYKDSLDKRTLITPYPYSFLTTFDEKFKKDHAKEIQEAENAKILIVGDRMGLSLAPYIQNLQNEFSASLKNPPSVFNWSTENEPLYRTIHKLKTLSKHPPIVIYFGASSELKEKRFDIKDKKNIFSNFKTFDNEKLISLIITFPILSKVLYKKINYQDLGDFKENKDNLAALEKLDEKEISYKLFEYEVKELIALTKDKKSNLVMITTPINLETEPKEVCAHSVNDDIIGIQQEIESEIKSGAFKSAYPKALELSSVTFSNARSFYLLGLAALGYGDIKVARESLLKASVFDCANWRGSAVYNAIMKEHATKNLVSIVDFDQLMNSQLSKEGLFFDEIIPQNIFYQMILDELSDILKNILSVNSNGEQS